ncbi:MAG: hypothetical protein HN509_00030 [Halobacteriovoraceae bacterium]|jgi:hypothetical protein|nr:hypothetical protein [Halobacteriovoraceae bacterium]
MSNEKAPLTHNFIEGILRESEVYNSLDQLETLVEEGADLSSFPIQPLYLAIKKLPVEKTALQLEKFSKEQRQAFRDLDLWQKDELDVETFQYWVKAYATCPNESIRSEFFNSEEFGLFLKGRFNIWTFDEEDPEYPDHDNYFLTDDHLLLFEFDDNMDLMHEVRGLIKDIYSEKGVEHAYAMLFKLTVDSYMGLCEEQYQRKKDRMRDFGFVDYYDALEMDNVIPSLELLGNFINKKTNATANIDSEGLKQGLHSTSILAFKGKMDNFSGELEKVQTEKRLQYLQFSFVRLINGTISANQAIKDGPMAMTRIGNNTRGLLTLGFSYLQKLYANGDVVWKSEEGLFERFDFLDIYKIGNTLIGLIRRDLKKNLKEFKFEENQEAFLGSFWGEFLDQIYDLPPTISDKFEEPPREIKTVEDYELALKKANSLNDLIPFASKFYQVFEKLKSTGHLQDSYYLNYKVDEIDLETILLNSYANYLLGNIGEKYSSKMGLDLDEFKKFTSIVLTQDGKAIKKQDKLDLFLKEFGLEKIRDFSTYLEFLLEHHLTGYDYSNLTFEEYKHVGGPIILATLKQ